MRKFLLFFYMTLLLLCTTISAHAVNITKSCGWFEAAYVEWTPEAGATYEVYVAEAGTENWKKLEKELLRMYNGYMRADAVGLKAGNYVLKVVSSVSGETKTSAMARRSS